ncbi:pyrin and HIN domain-containing protein 1-like isoform X1 [Mus caroli]|uniref:Pyrin and HIN domain-containing protein 1-like isoform X1 n=1 Tax=Mus caroli TaxID=10089 RepID=A0A6P5P4U2_MUSCR|nr:pyrin and HIN domain-containing protein 1-like isoform X1 [Mus caroli]
MVNEYKRIVLLTGLMGINDHDFRMVKSLLSKELKLNKMQDEYDRVKIADLMEDKFPKDAGVDQLIKLYKQIPGLGDIANKLKNEKAKAKKKGTGKRKTAVKRQRQEEPSTSQPMSTTNEDAEPESGRSTPDTQVAQLSLPTASRRNQAIQISPTIASSSGQTSSISSETLQSTIQSPETPTRPPSRILESPVSPGTASSSAQALGVPLATLAKRQRLKNVPKEPSEENGHQQGSKKVMVLKVTEPFAYDTKGEKMFHATVATETEFFRVKVFDIVLKEKFIPNKVLTISNYFGCNGFINIHSASSVSEVNDGEPMNIPLSLRKSATRTPKINYLCSKRRGIFVNGVFTVHKKEEKGYYICYEIGDGTGMMEVEVYGRLTNIACNPGDKLRLICFELTPDEEKAWLRSTSHSNMQVIKSRN